MMLRRSVCGLLPRNGACVSSFPSSRRNRRLQVNLHPLCDETYAQRDTGTHCSPPDCSHPGGSAASPPRSFSAAVTSCHHPCDLAAPTPQAKRDVAEGEVLRNTRSHCTPHYPGGPPACYGGGHCVPNAPAFIGRRPTRRDLIQWLHTEGRA